MKKLTHEEILQIKPSVEDVSKAKRSPFVAVLDNVRSLYNVGAIFRTSDAVMLEKLYLCGITGQPPRNEISKTALGADEIVPWEYSDSAVDVIKKLKKDGYTICAVELAHESISYEKADFNFPLCLIFGHEVEGISDEVMELADMAVKVPMLGRANSLNVETCYGIVVYEVLKKLNEKI
ncbi:RNA methyltransferase [Candidatus Peregrinibacteria bacterium CG_4_10_14_0_2_um_filter_38_24]|nr:MAG: RNA methyltransferase [Candidatus Peregrinibacteria bacterium CG_4_10_14_0_2_um_filter_38_24]PJC39395.1 MAG: RNA methyltransferase [Candidatus Peregrinibacteria bacterium CG_4_9_14_0_2_um_filter_38_9]